MGRTATTSEVVWLRRLVWAVVVCLLCPLAVYFLTRRGDRPAAADATATPREPPAPVVVQLVQPARPGTGVAPPPRPKPPPAAPDPGHPPAGHPNPVVVGPADARSHVGEWVVVEMVVKSAHAGRGGYAFLNSERSYKSPSNFVVVVPPAVLDELPGAGQNPPQTLVGETVRVEGRVKGYRGGYEIWADDVRRITVVRPASPPTR